MTEPTFLNRWDFLCCALLASVTFVLLLPLRHTAIGLMDEGVYLVYPDLMSNGWTMHRDFQNAYGPGEFWMLRGVYAIAGYTVASERLFTFAIRSILVGAIYILLRRHGRSVAIICASVCMLSLLLIPPRPTSWVTAAMFLVLALCAATDSKASKLFAVLTGIFVGAALTIRLDTIALAAAFSFPCLLLHFRKPRAYIFVIALLMSLIPFLFHLYFASWHAVIENMFVDPILRTAPGRRLPLPPSSVENFRSFIFLIVAITCGTLSALYLLSRQRSWIIVAAWLMIISFAPYILQRADRSHFMQGFSVILPLALFVILPALPRKSSVALAIIALAATLWITRFGLWGPAPSYTTDVFNPPATVQFHHGYRHIPICTTELPAYRALFHAIDQIKSAHTVFVAPSNLRFTPYSDMHLYYLLSDLTPSGYDFEMNPGCTNRAGSRLASDIANADLLILGTRYENWFEPNASTIPGSTDADAVVKRDFILKADTDIFRLYVNRKLSTANFR